jgi:hypothetical protein
MTKLDECYEITSLACDLKLDPKRPVEAIVRYCMDKITGWVRKAGGADSIEEVQNIVCRNLGLTLIEVRSDEELEEVAEKYVGLGEFVFASLSVQLTDDKFATVMRRQHAPAKAPDQYVAIIDCRGFKAARRFFTRWHEIAHILTSVTQHELPFQHFRSKPEGDPIERLMDHIAGQVGFYDPIFEPVLAAEIKKDGRLTFDAVERVRAAICPNASFEATLIACSNRMPTPVIQLHAAKGYKKAEEEELASGQLRMFGRPAPEPKLRAHRSVPNSAAKTRGFLVHQNMQVPEQSLVYKHFEETADVDSSLGITGVEEFSNWRCSNGKVCGRGRINVDVRKLSGTTFALLQPLG